MIGCSISVSDTVHERVPVLKMAYRKHRMVVLFLVALMSSRLKSMLLSHTGIAVQRESKIIGREETKREDTTSNVPRNRTMYAWV